MLEGVRVPVACVPCASRVDFPTLNGPVSRDHSGGDRHSGHQHRQRGERHADVRAHAARAGRSMPMSSAAKRRSAPTAMREIEPPACPVARRRGASWSTRFLHGRTGAIAAGSDTSEDDVALATSCPQSAKQSTTTEIAAGQRKAISSLQAPHSALSEQQSGSRHWRNARTAYLARSRCAGNISLPTGNYYLNGGQTGPACVELMLYRCFDRTTGGA